MPDLPEEDQPEHDAPDRYLDIEEIRRMAQNTKYSIRSHAVDHMVKEGFDEPHVLNAIRTGRVLEEHPQECRCLIQKASAWAIRSGLPKIETRRGSQ